MAFNTAGLGEKEVTDHCDVVRHLEGLQGNGPKASKRYIMSIRWSLLRCDAEYEYMYFLALMQYEYSKIR